MGYYSDWTAASLPPEKVNYDLYHLLDFAFAVPNKNFSLGWDNPKAPATLTRLVNAAHAKGKKIKLSIGGWTGSKYFSPAVASEQSRRVFAANILSLYTQFNLDGIDIDWEYPGMPGEAGNQVDPNDTANFLAFLQLLRVSLPRSALITAAAMTVPFADEDGAPASNVSEFANVLDWVMLMNYDVWGASENPGPNAPLYDACHNSSQPDASAVAGYNAWTSAGFPASKLVLGVPSYGYISKSSADHLRTHEDADTQVEFRNLVISGTLVRSSTGQFVGGNGFTRYWDNCSSTPYLRNAPDHQVITYDDPQSLAMKAEFAEKMGLRGVEMFDIHGDSDQNELIRSVHHAMGLE
ncbi:glycoside hydrolase family 18 protein [Fistulina hepatica ATCC 64428]|nr:glycoside hydrolase family 18 protein [Fistulina hepatica ATCC 64428]